MCCFLWLQVSQIRGRWSSPNKKTHSRLPRLCLSSGDLKQMGKENAVSRPFTRAFASALRASTTQNQQRVNTKRPASEDKNITASPSKKKKKKRAVLGDISSISLNASARLEVVKSAFLLMYLHFWNMGFVISGEKHQAGASQERIVCYLRSHRSPVQYQCKTCRCINDKRHNWEVESQIASKTSWKISFYRWDFTKHKF